MADGSPISWKRNLYALWLAQMLTIIGFSLRAPFLPFYIEDLGADSLASQALWAGVINAGGALVMAVSAPLWGIVAETATGASRWCCGRCSPGRSRSG